ncbi:MAG: PilZ domain-containing protein [Bdellovibrionota bacterium]
MSYFPPRRYPRVEFQPLPWIFSLRLPASPPQDRPLRLEARNISRGGLKFLCNQRFALFELLTFSLLEKSSGKPFSEITGKVVRVEEIDTGYGERTFGIAMEFISGGDSLSPLPEGSAPSNGK